MSDEMLMVLYFDAILFALVVSLVLLRFNRWLGDNQIHRTNRARTCGTCAYCESQRPIHPDGICCRHSYEHRENSSAVDFAVRPIVQLSWTGCGESEEKP